MDDPPRILALETSGRHGSVATLWGRPEGAELVGQFVLSPEQRTAQALAPSLRQLLRDVGWTPRSVKLVAVAAGPGSFTGLRIGVTTAKVLAYASGAEVVAVNTLDALAAQTPVRSSPLWTIMDAQRQELFAARYVVADAGTFRVERAAFIVAQDAWLTGLCAHECVTGPALARLLRRLPPGVETTPTETWQPMAAAVGRVAWRAYQAGERDDIWRLAPNYFRPSAAEEKHPT